MKKRTIVRSLKITSRLHRLFEQNPGGFSIKFCTGRLRPELQPLPWYPFNIPRAKLHPFLLPQGSTKTMEFPVIATFCPVFSRSYSVALSFLAKCVIRTFDILRFSHHFFHFVADFVTLSYTRMAIFPTLLYTASAKKAPFRAEPPRIARYREYPPPPPTEQISHSPAAVCTPARSIDQVTEFQLTT